MTRPLVSVLTPSFNQARWLSDNLRSVAGQSYRAIEHVVMDGGSTDGSVQILAAAPSRVLWESSPDLGQSDAINKAFAKSTGDIIGWLNSDDAYFSADVVSEAVRVFGNHPDVGVIYGHAALVNGSGTLLQVLWSPPYRRDLLRWYNYIYQPTCFVRRSALKRTGFVDPAFEYMMDRELWLHLAEKSQFHRLDRIVAIDRHHLLRKSYTRLDLAAHDDELLRQRYPLRRAEPNRLIVRGLGVGFRLAGLMRVAEAARGSDVLALDIPSLGAITARQVAQLRRRMPAGD